MSSNLPISIRPRAILPGFHGAGITSFFDEPQFISAPSIDEASEILFRLHSADSKSTAPLEHFRIFIYSQRQRARSGPSSLFEISVVGLDPNTNAADSPAISDFGNFKALCNS